MLQSENAVMWSVNSFSAHSSHPCGTSRFISPLDSHESSLLFYVVGVVQVEEAKVVHHSIMSTCALQESSCHSGMGKDHVEQWTTSIYCIVAAIQEQALVDAAALLLLSGRDTYMTIIDEYRCCRC